MMTIMLPALSFLYLCLDIIDDHLKARQMTDGWALGKISSYLEIPFPNSLVPLLSPAWGDSEFAKVIFLPILIIASWGVGCTVDEAISHQGLVKSVIGYAVISFSMYFLALYVFFHSLSF
ncbi:hypothetical protein ACFPL7_05730 [Dongia soli]|uniref:Uncharacterized protein n=1 Tax=Dongia soli TaxID=600628 RepID=A0ABU5EHN4_9PROT|nr:hypothetical protein [Dongia soli]MDY0884901.1 hypothetical protein [Dongia soli]